MTHIKGIFFDAADVFYYRPQATHQYALSLVKQAGLITPPSPAERKRLKSLRSQASKGHLSAEEYWHQFLLMHGVANPEERQRLIEQINAHSDTVLPIPGGREALAGLKQRGFILGIITDTMHPLTTKMRWLETVGVAEFIDVVACSTVLGAHKPEPTIYWHALEQTHLTPQESAFVGHDAGELAGARQVGMTTVAVNYDPEAKADYYCRSLLDLLNVPIFCP